VEATYKKNEVQPIQRRLMQAVNGDPDVPEHLYLKFDQESTNKDAV